MTDDELGRIRARLRFGASGASSMHRNFPDADVAALVAEVGRLKAVHSGLIHRLEGLMDRWGDERNAYVREANTESSATLCAFAMVRSETLLRSIDELDKAIPAPGGEE